MKYKFLLIIYLFIPFEVFSLEDEIFDINILVYNTHGLPEIFIDDNPKIYLNEHIESKIKDFIGSGILIPSSS